MPEPKIVKYGMPASESHKVVDSHFEIMTERVLLDELHLQAALRAGPAFSALNDKIHGR